MTTTTYENAGSFEHTAADWASLGEGMVAFEQECALRDLAANFDEVVAGKRKLNDHDLALVEMLQGVLKKAHLAGAVDGFATILAEGQNFEAKAPMRQIEDRADAYVRLVTQRSPMVEPSEVASSFAMETIMLWASLDADAFLALTDPHEVVSAAYRISEYFNCAAGRYGRALYDVNPSVFDTVTIVRGSLNEAQNPQNRANAETCIAA